MLMQTIARANRVTSFQISGVAKKNGEIVDDYNVLRNMKRALRDYAQGLGDEDEMPVQDKAAFFALLDDAVEQGRAYCHERGVPLREALGRDDVFNKLGQFNGFAHTLFGQDEGARPSTFTRAPSPACTRPANRKCCRADWAGPSRPFSTCPA